jgi:hypothetical protein
LRKRYRSCRWLCDSVFPRLPLAAGFALCWDYRLAVGANSTLLTPDSKTRPASTSEPKTFWAGVVDLLTNRQPLLFFLAIGIVIAVTGTHYLFTSLVTVRYAGESGVIVSLPGQTVYYLAIDPYESWINTGIQLAKDERFTVELSGRVSPGYLQGLERLQTQYDELSKATSFGGRSQVSPPPASTPLARWKFTGPGRIRPVLV